MLVRLLLLMSRLINRSGLRISHSKVFSSGDEEKEEIKFWSRYPPFKRFQLSSFKSDFLKYGQDPAECLHSLFEYVLLIQDYNVNKKEKRGENDWKHETLIWQAKMAKYHVYWQIIIKNN